MKSAVVRAFGGPENIVVEELPVPQLAANGQALIKVEAAGVNPVDTYIRQGTYPSLPQCPFVTGVEGAGVIQQINGSATLKPGDRVWFVKPLTGTTAEYCLADANLVFKLPDNVSFSQGATLGIAFVTAYRALFVKGGAQAGQSIFIHGISGGVGLASCQLAKVHGLRVFGTASSERGVELAKRSGAEQVYNHRENGYVQRIVAEHPYGFHLILEMLANVNLNHDLQLVAKQGRIVVIGNRGRVEMDPRDVMSKESSVVGVLSTLASDDDYQRIAERINGLLEGHHITPYVDQQFALEQIADAHRHVAGEQSKSGKVVVVVGANVPPQQPSQPQQPAVPDHPGDQPLPSQPAAPDQPQQPQSDEPVPYQPLPDQPAPENSSGEPTTGDFGGEVKLDG